MRHEWFDTRSGPQFVGATRLCRHGSRNGAAPAGDPDGAGEPNRGVWEAGWWRGPAVSVAHTSDDVDLYIGVLEDVLASIT